MVVLFTPKVARAEIQKKHTKCSTYKDDTHLSINIVTNDSRTFCFVLFDSLRPINNLTVI